MCDTLARSIHVASFRAIVALSLALLLTSMLPASLQAARGGGGKTEVLPVQKAAPAAAFIETPGTEADLRRQLRAKNAWPQLGTQPQSLVLSSPNRCVWIHPA